MFITLRKFTVIFLAILQLIAPLVHAHVGEKTGLLQTSGSAMLHVPGLERYTVDREVAMPRTEMLHCKVSMHDANSDGMLIGIDAGIKDRQADGEVDLDHSCYLLQRPTIVKTAISPLAIPIPLQAQLFVQRLFIPSLSPRAPPAQ